MEPKKSDKPNGTVGRWSAMAVIVTIIAGSVVMSSIRAHADFVVPVPSECPPRNSISIVASGQTHDLTSVVSGANVSGSFTVNPANQGNGVDTGTGVTFVLDLGSNHSMIQTVGTTLRSEKSSYNYSFTGLSAGSHSIVACEWSGFFPSHFNTGHTDIAKFNIQTVPEFPVAGIIMALGMLMPLLWYRMRGRG